MATKLYALTDDDVVRLRVLLPSPIEPLTPHELRVIRNIFYDNNREVRNAKLLEKLEALTAKGE